MHIEIKIAQWKRIKIPKNLEEDFAKKVMSREIKDSEHAILYLNNHSEISQEVFGENLETISPANNFGEATFQMFDKHNNLVFSNDIEEEKSQTG
jgi:hypothetical protein